MTYAEPLGDRDRVVERTTIPAVVDYHDLIRWGPILAGIVVAVATQLILSALGVAIGLTAGASGSDPNSVSLGVGIWSIISLLIALFLGSWVMTNGCGPMNSKTAMLHGFILWATTLTISAWLLASGVSGAFGIVAANAGEVLNQAQQQGTNLPSSAPNVSSEEARQIAGNSAKAAWSFIVGSLLGLAASLIGSSVGAKNPRKVRHSEVRHNEVNT
jgi:hypothetical protein